MTFSQQTMGRKMASDWFTIRLGNKGFRQWKAFGESFVKGLAWANGLLLSEKELYEACISAIERDDFASFLKTLDGHFAAIIVTGEKMYLVVDAIRSYPILFSVKGQTYLASDEAEGVKEFVKDQAFNKLAVAEFLAKGYLSKGRTLFSDTYSVEAGEYVLIDRSGFRRQTYYEYLYPTWKNGVDEIVDHAFAALEQSFSSLLETIKGRQVVLPLSGGYDSRLIACLCKKAGLTDVVCFTYGKAKNWDSATSEKVARSLGYKWFFVEYTDRRMYKFFHSEEYKAYRRYAGNLDATPHTQDLLAIHCLLKQEAIKKDAVVIPGHSGDLLGGSHLPSMTGRSPLYKVIYATYYRLGVLKKRYRSLLYDDLKANAGSISARKRPDRFAHLFTNWGIKSRQATFIVNSVRIYDFYGLDWRLPLWNKAFVESWLSIAWIDKQDLRLYHRALFTRYFDVYAVNIPKEAVSGAFFRKTGNALCTWIPLLDALKKRMDAGKKDDVYNYQTLLGTGDVTEDYLKQYLSTPSSSVNAVFAVEYIRYCRTLSAATEEEFLGD